MERIGLMDCNNFFVSCERLFRPDLQNKPVAVLSSNDGCIVARSQEVKDMGIPMGLPLFQAKRLVDVSAVTFFSSNFTLYRDISRRVMAALAQEVGACEVYSVDEAFFALPNDWTQKDIVQLRARIVQHVGIPVSIGVAPNKTLAKQASGIGKKGSGVCVLLLHQWQQYAKETPCGEIWNLGRKTVAKLEALQVRTAYELMQLDAQLVQQQLGIAGRRVQDELRGKVVHALHERAGEIRQSIVSSRSFTHTSSHLSHLQSAIAHHVTQVAAKLREQELVATTLQVSIRPSRHSDFALRGTACEVVFDQPTNSTHTLLHEALQATQAMFDASVPYKKAGVSVSGLFPQQMRAVSLFDEDTQQTQQTLDAVTDTLNARYGANTVQFASLLNNAPQSSAKLRSQAYTTMWKDIPRVHAK